MPCPQPTLFGFFWNGIAKLIKADVTGVQHHELFLDFGKNETNQLSNSLLKPVYISLPARTNGKPLAATSIFPSAIGKLMIGKTFATNGEEITSNAMIGNDVLANIGNHW